MPRPTRLQYEDACYHAMNRGRGRQVIFHDERYYEAFLCSLEEACSRFKLEVLAYCLMGNHYHLFVRTPLANLDRCMRHINGVYTQRYNRLKNTDGPLFRGRYKSILVEVDAYGLQLSRYIHRNPIETKRPLVAELESYPWSSYPAYLNHVVAPSWLYRDLVYDFLGVKKKYFEYRRYVELGVDEETEAFYGKGSQAVIFGTEGFVEESKEKFQEKRLEINNAQGLYPSIDQIVAHVAKCTNTKIEEIVQSKRGRGRENIPRWIALYLSRELSQTSTRVIVNRFGLGHISGINQAVYKLKSRLSKDKDLENQLNIMYQYLTP